MLSPLTVKVSVLSSLIATLSHVILDSIMHYDMTPFAPFSEGNGLLNIISLQSLHLFCVITGVVGLIWCGILAKKSITCLSAGATSSKHSLS